VRHLQSPALAHSPAAMRRWAVAAWLCLLVRLVHRHCCPPLISTPPPSAAYLMVTVWEHIHSYGSMCSFWSGR
jgi:hypothetical protein